MRKKSELSKIGESIINSGTNNYISKGWKTPERRTSLLDKYYDTKSSDSHYKSESLMNEGPINKLLQGKRDMRISSVKNINLRNNMMAKDNIYSAKLSK